MDLIIIIAVISFIVKSIKNADGTKTTNSSAKKHQKNDRWKTSSQTTYATRQRSYATKEENEHWKNVAKENIEKEKTRAKKAMVDLKRELELEEDGDYERQKPLEKKTTNQRTSAKQQIFESRKEAQTTSILGRAKANVAEDKEDVTLRTLEVEHQHSERVAPAEHYHPEDILSDNLLGSVEDLMVKGYEGNLCFERDFVGEALDMISRFTVPSEVPDFSGNQDDVA